MDYGNQNIKWDGLVKAYRAFKRIYNYLFTKAEVWKQPYIITAGMGKEIIAYNQ